jgi:TctA family transporter
MDPNTASPRWTMGWEYLGDGVQIIPIMAGVLAFPELLSAYWMKAEKIKLTNGVIVAQLIQGVKDTWRYRWDGLRGGFIGGFIGLIPGIGGAIADWFAYSQTVALGKRDGENVGQGHVRGVIGCEGANNAQKATSYVPTVLFGIPGAPFEVIVMGLLMYVGLELGTPSVLSDTKFFDTLLSSYLWSLLIILPISYGFIKYAVYITNIPFRYYFWPILASLIWASTQYTGMFNDYAMLAICCCAGMVLKFTKFSRVSFLIGYILSARLESSWVQFDTFGYGWRNLLLEPMPLIFLTLAVSAAIWGIFFNKARIDFV